MSGSTAFFELWPRFRSAPQTDAATFLRDESGASFVMIALMVPVILGFAGLGLDASLWLMHKRQVQSITDAAAMAAGNALAGNASTTEIEDAARTSASENGFTPGGTESITVNAPPQFGANIGSAAHVEVIIDYESERFLSSWFNASDVFVQTRAVAGVDAYGQVCVLALDQGADAAVHFTASSDATVSCGVASNSNSNSAVLIEGNTALTSDPVMAYGDIEIQGSGDLESASPPQTYAQRLADPYADVSLPSGWETDDCLETNLNIVNDTRTLDPGRYCGGIRITDSEVTFNPGEYILDDGDLSVQGDSTLDGDDVTFFFTAVDPDDTGGLNFTGGTAADLSAPTSGDYAGILFYQDPGAPAFQGANLIENDLLGGSQVDLSGAMYFPNQGVTFSGGADIANGCLQIVARTVSFQGESSIQNSAAACAAQGVASISQQRVKLVE